MEQSAQEQAATPDQVFTGCLNARVLLNELLMLSCCRLPACLLFCNDGLVLERSWLPHGPIAAD